MRGFPVISLVPFAAFFGWREYDFRNSSIIVVFLFISFYAYGQSPETTPPEYDWLSKKDIGEVTVDAMNTEDIVIAIASDDSGNIYTLSFGSGIDKRGPDGNIIESNFISASDLDNPLDLAIDEQGFIYVADYLAGGDTYDDNGKIKVFDPQGNYLPGRTILTSFYRPLGVDVAFGKVYVAEFNAGTEGPEQDQVLSRIRIYDKLSGAPLVETDEVSTPFRIAVSSQQEIYVSQAGNNEPSVLIFDGNLALEGKLPNIVSPGSVVVDPFDFVHVTEYNNRVDFNEFINFESLSFGEAMDIAARINRGIENEEFVVKIFNPNGNLEGSVLQGIDFPLDMTFNQCDRMYVDNADINGFSIFGSFFPTGIDFDLEIYERTPSFDVSDPVIICPDDIEITLEPGETSTTVVFDDATVTDDCAVSVTQTGGESSGSQFAIGPHTIEFTATDSAGNTSQCSFTITVIGEDEPAFEDCPSGISRQADPDLCGAVITFTEPAAFRGSEELTVTQTAGPASGEFFPVGETTVTFQATDSNDETITCSFVVVVEDLTPPSMDCPTEITDTFNPDEGYILPDYRERFVITDVCDLDPVVTQDPPPGTTVFEEITPISLTMEDESGNIGSCGFDLALTAIRDPLDISCPETQTVNLNENCEVVIRDYRALAETNYPDAEIIQSPAAGEIVESKENISIELTATFEGEADSCSFSLVFVDETDPVLDCPSDQHVTYNPAEGYSIPDYSDRVQAQDNCTEVVPSQSPSPGTVVFEDTEVQLSFSDAAGNSSECFFTVILNEEESLEISCPEDQEGQLDPNCQFVVPDFRELAEVNNMEADISQVPEVGTVITENTEIVLTATFENQSDTCSFDLILIDELPPQANCISTFTINLDENGTASITEDHLDNGSTDNCGIVNRSLSRYDFSTADVDNSPISVTLTLTDEQGNVASCTTEVIVEAYDPENPDPVSCVGSVTLQLNENGEAELDVEELYEGELGEGGTATVNQQSFTCDHLGEQTVTLTYSGNSSGSCRINVIVQDNIPPVPRGRDIEISLDENGVAFLSPASVNSGSSDNCGSMEMRLSRSDFTCADLGENRIDFIVQDRSGNSASMEVTVTVTDPAGFCNAGPVEPPVSGPYVILFPNPSRGVFEIATSSETSFSKVEIFDMRSRFLKAHELRRDPGTGTYHFDLQKFQTGVYILKLYSEEREYIRRAIITTF